jgi:hypothetical protein
MTAHSGVTIGSTRLPSHQEEEQCKSAINFA